MKVLIADDHPLMLAGLRSVLETTEGFEIVGEAHSGPEVLPLIGRTAPDVVLLDLLMPGIDGLGCLDRSSRDIRKRRSSRCRSLQTLS
jgi:DNA-binding NarL/FixJ family response regulator